MTNSKRLYELAIAEPCGLQIINLSFDRLMNTEPENDFEYLYSIREIIDDLLDLMPGQSMYFSPSRDNKEIKGIIYRTK